MIEVRPDGNGFRWHLIAACGRTLWTSGDHFACDKAAHAAANAFRQGFWALAQLVDHRQARCI